LEPRADKLYTPLCAQLMREGIEVALEDIVRPNPSMIERYVWQLLHRIRNLEILGGGQWVGDTDYLDGEVSPEEEDQ
jgi:hypothetical protein